ncbi:MAG: hypothetical protein AABZ55_11450 [Bdellovibrionota bacterium]
MIKSRGLFFSLFMLTGFLIGAHSSHAADVADSKPSEMGIDKYCSNYLLLGQRDKLGGSFLGSATVSTARTLCLPVAGAATTGAISTRIWSGGALKQNVEIQSAPAADALLKNSNAPINFGSGEIESNAASAADELSR